MDVCSHLTVCKNDAYAEKPDKAAPVPPMLAFTTGLWELANSDEGCFSIGTFASRKMESAAGLCKFGQYLISDGIYNVSGLRKADLMRTPGRHGRDQIPKPIGARMELQSERVDSRWLGNRADYAVFGTFTVHLAEPDSTGDIRDDLVDTNHVDLDGFLEEVLSQCPRMGLDDGIRTPPKEVGAQKCGFASYGRNCCL